MSHRPLANPLSLLPRLTLPHPAARPGRREGPGCLGLSGSSATHELYTSLSLCLSASLTNADNSSIFFVRLSNEFQMN